MKLSKVLASAGAVAVVAGAGFLAVPTAQAAAPVFTATSGHVTCNIAGKAGIVPALANDWKAADHTDDPSSSAVVDAVIASIPDTTYSSAGPATTSASIKSSSCPAGSANDGGGGHTATVTAIAVTAGSVGTTPGPATCAGLVPDPDNPTVFTSTITYKATGATVNPTTVTSTLGITADPITGQPGFSLTASKATGSFAFNTATANNASVANAYIDNVTLGAFLGGQSTSAGSSTSVCEPGITFKHADAAPGVSETASAKLKKPKGLKTIGVCPCTGVTAQSTLDIKHN